MGHFQASKAQMFAKPSENHDETKICHRTSKSLVASRERIFSMLLSPLCFLTGSNLVLNNFPHAISQYLCSTFSATQVNNTKNFYITGLAKKGSKATYFPLRLDCVYPTLVGKKCRIIAAPLYSKSPKNKRTVYKHE